MATTPKKLIFKLYFRKKTKTRKIKHRERKLRQLSKRVNAACLKSSCKTESSKCLISLAWVTHGSKSYESGHSNSYPEPVDYGEKQVKIKECSPIVYPKQQRNTWLISSKDVYLKTQARYSLSSKKLLFGLYGVCVIQYATISAAYVETIKLDVAKILKKKGRVWTRICCDSPVSARPAETRMGKGKGSISYWVAKVEPGQLLFEFSGITETQLDEIFQKLCKKTSIGLKIVS